MEPLKGALQGFWCVKNEEMWACWSLKPTTGRQWGCLKLDANGERGKTLSYTVCGAGTEIGSESATLYSNGRLAMRL